MKAFITGLLKNLAHPGTIIGLVVALAIPFLIYLGPNVGHKDTIKYLDLNLPLPLFLVQLVTAIILFYSLSKDFREWIKGILPEKSISILMLVFAAVITIFAATQIEARHRVQSDESVFMSVAQNMYYNHESGTCNQGFFENGKLKCVATSNSFKTKGLAFLYLLGMPLLGNDLHWIFNMELLMLPLAMLLMFLAIVAWTRQPLLAFFAALLTALQAGILCSDPPRNSLLPVRIHPIRPSQAFGQQERQGPSIFRNTLAILGPRTFDHQLLPGIWIPGRRIRSTRSFLRRPCPQLGRNDQAPHQERRA